MEIAKVEEIVHALFLVLPKLFKNRTPPPNDKGIRTSSLVHQGLRNSGAGGSPSEEQKFLFGYKRKLLRRGFIPCYFLVHPSGERYETEETFSCHQHTVLLVLFCVYEE